MSHQNLLNYIYENYSIKLDELNIQTYQDIIDNNIDLLKLTDDIYNELILSESKINSKKFKTYFIQTPKNLTLLNILKYLEKIDYPHAIYRLAMYYDNCYKENRNRYLYKQYLLKAVNLNYAPALYLYYLNFWDIHNDVILINSNKSIKPLVASAKQLYAPALVKLSEFYLHGEKGLTKDVDMALVLLNKALKQNYYLAYYNLANMYYKGIGVKVDYIKALANYKKVCSLTPDNDQYVYYNSIEKIAFIYEEGLGTSKDMSEAFKWYSLGEHHSDICNLALAEYYLNGEIIKHNLDKVYELSVKYVGTVAKPANYERNYLLQDRLKHLYLFHARMCITGRLGRYKKWNKTKREENFIFYLQKSADLCNEEGLYYLALQLYNGELINKNIYDSISYFIQSAELGYKEAQEQLGVILLENYTLYDDKNDALDMAIYWLREANKNTFKNFHFHIAKAFLEKFELFKYDVHHNKKVYINNAISEFKTSFATYNVEAALYLGRIYFHNKYNMVDYKESLYWLKQAAKSGYGEAYYLIGLINYKIEKYDKAIICFEKAIDYGYIMEAAHTLGNMYNSGIGVEVDKTKAKEYYDLAISKGFVM